MLITFYDIKFSFSSFYLFKNFFSSPLRFNTNYFIQTTIKTLIILLALLLLDAAKMDQDIIMKPVKVFMFKLWGFYELFSKLWKEFDFLLDFYFSIGNNLSRILNFVRQKVHHKVIFKYFQANLRDGIISI